MTSVAAGQVFGIRVRLSFYFVGLIVLLASAGELDRAIMAFGIVLLHETGHVMTARWFGLSVPELELLPFGGVARIEDLAHVDPRCEMMVAAAGPVTNLLLIGLVIGMDAVWNLPPTFKSQAIQMNAALAAFNLLPAFPLDGGRILRAVQTTRLGYREATAKVARVGRVVAWLMAGAGLIGLLQGWLSLTVLGIALFIYPASSREEDAAQYVVMQELTRKRRFFEHSPCSEGRVVVIKTGTPVKEVMRRLVPGRFHLVWIIDDRGRARGMVTEAELLDRLSTQGIDCPVENLLNACYDGPSAPPFD